MEACAEAGIQVWILDRPNPISRIPCDGPVLKKDFLRLWAVPVSAMSQDDFRRNGIVG